MLPDPEAAGRHRSRGRPRCAGWADSGRTTSRNTGQRCAPMSVIPPGPKAYAQVTGTRDTVYGSAGWVAESIHSRSGGGIDLGRLRHYAPPHLRCLGGAGQAVPAGAPAALGRAAAAASARVPNILITRSR